MTMHKPAHRKPRFSTIDSLSARTAVRSLVGFGVVVAAPATASVLAAPAQASDLAGSDQAANSTASAPTSAAAVAPTTAAGVTPMAAPCIYYGSAGPAVKIVQQRVGAYVDGWFGPRTRDAVKRFQSSQGLVADGIVGPLTWAKIGTTDLTQDAVDATTSPDADTTTATAPTAASTVPTSATLTTTLTTGATGPFVKDLQTRLGVSVTGVYDAATRAAVMSYQSAHGVVADGNVSPSLWIKLGSASAATPAAPATPAVTTPASAVTPTPVTTTSAVTTPAPADVQPAPAKPTPVTAE